MSSVTKRCVTRSKERSVYYFFKSKLSLMTLFSNYTHFLSVYGAIIFSQPVAIFVTSGKPNLSFRFML